jgi:hypothetical protein
MSGCQWPDGDKPPFVFCGQPVARPGCPWCAEHEHLAHRPPAAGALSGAAGSAGLLQSPHIGGDCNKRAFSGEIGALRRELSHMAAVGSNLAEPAG